MTTQTQYKILSCFISADRRGNGANLERVDIGPSISELHIYESMERAYLTGELLLADTIAIRSTFQIKGNERLEIKIQSDNERIITKKFMVTGIEELVAVTDRSEVLRLGLTEEHAYWSSSRELSKAFTGRPLDIIQKILEGELDKETDTFLAVPNGEAQSVIKYLVPGITALQAVENVRDRCATPTGGSYMVYSTLRDDKIKISELDLLLSQEAWNKQIPYIRSTIAPNARSNATDVEQLAAQYFHVKEFGNGEHESTFKLMMDGALGSVYDVYDVSSGSSTPFTHSGIETLTEFYNRNRLAVPKTEEPNIDGELILGNNALGTAKIDTLPSRGFSVIVNGFPYGKHPDSPQGFHDEGIDRSRYLNVLKNASLRSILMNNVYNITVPGGPYIMFEDAGVGSVIELKHPSITAAEANQSTLDPDRSGRFLIYQTRHRFYRQIYDVDMDVIKFTRAQQ